MTKRRRGLALGLAAVAVCLAACVDEGAPAPEAEAEASSEAARPAVAASTSPDTVPSADLSILQVMQELEVRMERVHSALWTGDTAALAAAAQAVADHPTAGPAARQRMMAVLGEEAAAFRQHDVRVHDAAAAMAEAAAAGDLDAALARLAEVERGCVACHRQFREPLRASRP